MLALLLAVLLAPAAYASDELYSRQSDASGISEIYEKLDEDTKQLLEQLGVSGADFEQLFSVTPKKFISLIFDIFTGRAVSPLKSGLKILAALMLSSLVNGVLPEGSGGRKAASFMCGVFTVLCVAFPASSVIGNARSAISLCSEFMLIFIPVFAAAVAAAGNPVLAVSYGSFATGILQVISQTVSTLMLPLVNVSAALGITGAVAPQLAGEKFASAVRKTVTFTLGFAGIIFSGLLSVKSLLAASSDTLASRGVKFLLGSAVPVVGAALSEAYSSVVGGLSMLKNTAGVFGIAVCILMFLPVAAELTAWLAVFFFCGVCADMLGEGASASLMSSLSSCTSVLLSMTVFMPALTAVSLGIVLKIRTG